MLRASWLAARIWSKGSLISSTEYIITRIRINEGKCGDCYSRTQAPKQKDEEKVICKYHPGDDGRERCGERKCTWNINGLPSLHTDQHILTRTDPFRCGVDSRISQLFHQSPNPQQSAKNLMCKCQPCHLYFNVPMFHNHIPIFHFSLKHSTISLILQFPPSSIPSLHNSQAHPKSTHHGTAQKNNASKISLSS